uniref:WRKY19-like zinc finger domain-containing protein n=1 Tax=Phytophthora ramorum TaxID=164328 RepID=H3GLP5_PHYRM
MSIESVQDADAAQSRPTNMVHKTVRLQPPMAIAQQTQYSDMLLGDMGMMGCDVDAWSRPQQYAPQPQQQQQFGFACPPAVLTRHVSMPVAAPRQVTPVQYQQQPATSFAMGMPPTLARHHSHGYVSVMQQQQQGYQTAMNVPMPPRQVHVNEMQHLLEISMGQQQPLQYQQRYMKSEPMSSSSAMNVEPIAFAPADNNAKLAMDDLDPLAYAVFGNATAHKPALPGMPQDIQQIESAFDSLDRLLPEIEQEMLFRSPEMDQFAQSAVTANIKPTTKSPKSMATCKVGGCERRVRSKGFCKTHGGGRKCSIEGCKKSSQNGDFCIGHGGGKKCKEEGCAKAAQSHGLCKAHGGGARCKFPNCNKSSQGGGLCRAHGGGKRCQAQGCPKGAQRGNFCATHGGFRNCKIEGCVRTDRGGGFCEVHRRGRLCKVEGCKKLSRNQGMCTMHIREEKQDSTNFDAPMKAESAVALAV